MQTTYVAPRNEIEGSIAEIWQRLLGIEQVGIYDNFFELGGHSLLIIQLASQLRAYQLEIVATPRSDEKLGTVKWYNPVKGYGFIEPKDGSLDVFMHAKIFGGNEHVPKALIGRNVCYTDRPNRENSKLSLATSVQAI